MSESEEGALLTENKYFYICIHDDRLQAVRAVERMIECAHFKCEIGRVKELEKLS